MTPEQQRIAIAEACGWKWYRQPASGPWARKPMRSLYHPDLIKHWDATFAEADMTESQCNPAFIWREGNIPDYPSDLNAMHEAEKTLSEGQRDDYVFWITELACFRHPVPHACHSSAERLRAIRATAAQRAEAFLRTLGKWKD